MSSEINSFGRKLASYTHELLLAAALAGLLIYAHGKEPVFVSSAGQQGLYSHVWNLAILALPMTFIIITGGIDLSVGSAMALSSVTLGMLFGAGANIWVASAAALLVGLLCGLLNGFFIAKVKVHPLIVTLATFSAFRGLAEGISLPHVYSGFPASFTAIGQNVIGHGLWADPRNPHLWDLQAAGWFLVVAAIFSAIVLAKSPFGRSLYAIGFNEKAARYSGIKVDRIKMIIYTLSGLAAGLVSVNYSALRDNAQAAVGQNMELDVITAVVLGGTSIFGGRGRILGTILGVALIHETKEYVGWHYNRNELVPVVLGVLLIVSVAANALLSRKDSRK